MTLAHTLIVDAMKAGILLIAKGDRLRYKAMRPVPTDLLRQFKVNKPALLDVLGATEEVEASTATNDCPAIYSAGGHRLLKAAEMKPGDLSPLESTKEGSLEAVVIDDQLRPQNLGKLIKKAPSTTRLDAARHIRQARRANDRGLSVAMRDAWRERLAICMVEGDLPLEEAQRMALEELRKFNLTNH